MATIKNIEEALAFIQSETELMRKKLDEVFPEPAKMESYDAILTDVPLFKYSFEYVSNNGASSAYSSWNRDQNKAADTREKIIARRDVFLPLLDQYLAMGEPIKERNAARVVHNKALHEKITLLMQRMGIKKYYTTEYVRRKPKSTSHEPGYLRDLIRDIPVVDSYAIFKQRIENKRTEITRWAQGRLATIDQEVAARIAAEKDQKKTQYLATMRVRYGLNYDAGSDEILDAILAQSPHLKFAHWLYRNRTDWNDGTYYAKIGINGFSPADDRDRAIYERIKEKIDDWDGDGRVFKSDYEELFIIAAHRANEASLDYDAYREFFPNDD